MQTILGGLHSDDADHVQQELEEAYNQFIFHLQAARESVALYETQYKHARRLLVKLRRQSEANQTVP